jgi:hypothetical protein
MNSRIIVSDGIEKEFITEECLFEGSGRLPDTIEEFKNYIKEVFL